MSKKKDFEIEFEKIKKCLLLNKQSFSEHLSAINENTSELQSFFDHLNEIEQKLEKTSQRLDNLELQNHLKTTSKPYILPLNNTEKKLFLVIYTEDKPLNCWEISQKSGIPLSVIREYISSISQKGIPLNRSFQDSQTFYRLDPKFRDWQAKHNIINLSLDSFLDIPETQTKLVNY